jgi:hypothetical protein
MKNLTNYNVKIQSGKRTPLKVFVYYIESEFVKGAGK